MLKHLLLSMLTPFYCLAADFLNESNVSGGLVHIPVADSHSKKPRVLFQGKKVLVVK